MALNELCRSTLNILRADLTSFGIVFDYYFTHTRNAPNCAGSGTGGGAFGNAILVRGNDSIALVSIDVLPQGGETRKLTCVQTWVVPVPGAPKICGVHIDPQNTDDQIEMVGDIVVDEAPFAPILLMGDFNREPDHPDMIPTETFFDLDDVTPYGESPFIEATLDRGTLGDDRKFDYSFVEFVSTYPYGWSFVFADATSSNFSDHDPLVGSSLLTYATDEPDSSNPAP